MLNKIIISGRLTKDPDLRYTQSQKPVTSFAVACERDYNPNGGSKETDFISCVAWNSKADFVDKWFKKGQMITVVGRLQSRDWTDRDGNKHKEWEINVEEAYFGESKKSEAPPKAVDAGPNDLEEVDEGLPF